MNVFELFAKLSLDSSDFEKGVTQAEAAFDDLGDSAADVSADAAKAEKAADKLGDAVEQAGDEARRAAPEIASASEQIAKTGTESAGAAPDVDDLAGTLAAAAATGNLIAEAIGGIWNFARNAAAAIWNLDEATEEYRGAMGKLNTAFEVAGYSTSAAKKTFTEFYKILGDTDTATEASQLLARLSTNQADLTRWTTIASGVNGTFGDSLPIEGLIEASNETAKVGRVTGVLADALNWVGISEDDFNVKLAATASMEERTALITETLEAKYTAAADALRENNAEVIAARESQLRLQDGQAKLGEQTSRLKTALSTGLAPAMEKIYGWATKITGGIANIVEEWSTATNELSRPLKTDNIEEAKAQIAEMEAEIERLTEATMMMGDSYSTVYDDLAKLKAQHRGATAQLAEMEAAAAENTETVTANADAVDMLTVSIHGYTVELANSNMTMEEASERLNAYADAATNMFSAINTESELSYQQALDNMAHNIQATQDFGDNMAQLAGTLPRELADMFAAGGPEVYAGVVAMLAEANAGADVGLTQLNELYAQGGAAAVNAYVEALTGISVDTENPATIMANAMDADVSSEQAAQDVVIRASDAMKQAAETAGFDTAGSRAMNKFIAGMENRRSEVNRVAASIAQDAANIINDSINGVGTGGTGRYSAGGLDYVPYNGFPSILHKGEAVLTASEADAWRRGSAAPANGGGIVVNINVQSEPQSPVELAAACAAAFEQARWAI